MRPGRGGHGYLAGLYDYNYAILQANYLNVGFMRRGLGATLFTLFDSGRIAESLIRFHVFVTLWALIPTGVWVWRLVRRRTPETLWLALVVALSPELFLAWGGQVGKGDMLIVGLLSWAALAMSSRRYLVAAGVIFVGSLIHETALIYGGPLCLGLGLLQWRHGELAKGRSAGAVLALGALLACVSVLETVFGASHEQIARAILNSGPIDPMWTHAANMTGGGLKSIIVSQCQNFARPPAVLYLVSCYVACAIYGVVLLVRSREALLLYAFTSVAPMTAMALVATDNGRWLSFALMSGWLAISALALGDTPQPPVGRGRLAPAIGGLALLLLLGPPSIYYSSKAVGVVAAGIWGPETYPMQYYDRCEPHWRDLERLRTVSPGFKAASG